MNINVHTIRNGVSEIYFGVNSMEIYTSKKSNFVEYTANSTNNFKQKLNTSLKNNIEKKHIDQITLCVSNDCNLRCKYCYAQGGNYGTQRLLMSKSTAKTFVEFCIREFTQVKRILFFGGEPFLNWKVIKYICELFTEKLVSDKFPLPIFTVVTNGTILNNDILDIIKKHISLITISIDGNKKVNDSNRVYSNGKGTYNDISLFINKVTTNASCFVKYEATFTEEHQTQGLNRYLTEKYIKTHFNIKGEIVDDIQLKKQDAIKELEILSIDNIIESDLDCLPRGFWKVLNLLTTKSSATFCPIYKKRITITTDGNIVPCQMIIGKQDSICSSIFDTNVAIKLEAYSKNYKNNILCNSCWCNSLCGGCTVNQFYSFEGNKFSEVPDINVCQHTRKYIETIILLIYKFSSNSQLWSLLINKFKQIHTK